VGEVLLNDNASTPSPSPAPSDTGRKVAAAAVGRMAKVQLEMGGKNPLVVPTTPISAVAVNCAVQGASSRPGSAARRRPASSSTDKIHDKFVARWSTSSRRSDRQRAQAGTDIGPVVEDSSSRPTWTISRSSARRRKLVVGGERLNREPTATTCAGAVHRRDNTMRVAAREIFGPSPRSSG